MKIMRKYIITTVAALSIVSCLLVTNIFAMNTTTVTYQWDSWYNSNLLDNNTWTENVYNKDLLFVNGYTYTTTQKDISGIRALAGIFGTRYYRNFSTY